MQWGSSGSSERLASRYGGERLEIRRIRGSVNVCWCCFRAALSWNICGSQPSKQRTHLIIHHHSMPSREDTPHFIFINPKSSEYEDPSTSLCDAWNRAIAQYFPSDPSPPFTVYEGTLNELDADLLRCDCIVSPANSYGIMDGGCATYPSWSKHRSWD